MKLCNRGYLDRHTAAQTKRQQTTKKAQKTKNGKRSERDNRDIE
jgi:hypothetical protein